MNATAAFWSRFRTNRPAVAGLAVLGAVVAMAAVGPLLYPVDPFDMVAITSIPANWPVGPKTAKSPPNP